MILKVLQWPICLDPSMILGMIWIKSSELSRLAAVTAAVAPSTTDVIWALVRELERVLLELRNETLLCLELLVDERLELSSLITEDAREASAVVVSDVTDVSESDVVEEELPPPSVPHEIMVKHKSNTKRNSKILFIISLLADRKMRVRKIISLSLH